MSLGILPIIVVATEPAELLAFLAGLLAFLAELLATLAELATEPAAKPTREVALIRRSLPIIFAVVSEVASPAIVPTIMIRKPGWGT